MIQSIEQIVGDFLARRQSNKAHSPLRKRSMRTPHRAIRTTHSLERLEFRQLLSGETVSASLGSTPLPIGAQLQVVYRTTVNNPLSKGITANSNQASISGSNFATIKSSDPDVITPGSPTSTTIDRAPEATGVFVSSSLWSPAFLSGLQTAGVGDSTFGYAVPTGAAQLSAIPWGGIDRVSVRFSENVTVAADDLQLFGSNVASYALNAAGFTYDSTSHTATWALSGGINNDQLRIVVDGSSAGVVQPGIGGGQLDGEWIDSSAVFPSGDGVAGGDFAFRMNVLMGDVTGDGVVNTTDGVNIRRGMSPATYNPLLDINADAAVNTTDFVNDRGLIGTTSPATGPGGTAGSGWVAASTNYVPNVAGITSNLFPSAKVDSLVVDADGDGQADPGDTIQYTITFTNNSGADANNVAMTDVLDANSTLVAGALKVSPVLADSVDTAPLAYAENDPATAALPNLIVTDADGTISSASITVTGWADGQDSLTFGTVAGIVNNYDAANGTISFTGAATPADYQTLLRSLTFSNSSQTPNTAARSLSVTVSDGTFTSNAIQRAINVTSVNDSPVLSAIEGSALSYTEGAVAATISGSLAVADVDSTNLTGATVQITGNYANGQDVLSFANQLGITGSFAAATGTLTLSGAASLSDYQTALRAVKYSNTSTSPSTAQRTVTFQVNDGQAANNLSNTQIRNITVIAVNDAPTLTGLEAGALPYTENDPAAAITGSIVVGDADSVNLTGATIQITGNYVNGQDVLGFTNQLGITGNFVAATGTLTLTGTASLANYQTALRAVTYLNNSDNPSTLQRTITFQVNDGQAANNVSNSPTRAIGVTSVNDAPALSAIEGSALPYTENAAATAITGGIVVGDVDSANITGATVQITGNYASGQDVLSFTNQLGITGNFVTATGTLTLTGTTTLANYQAALRTVKYQNTSDDPSALSRTVTFQVNDGAAANNLSNLATRAINITAVNDAPTARAKVGATYTAAANIQVTVAAANGLLVDSTDVEAGTTLTMDTTPINVTNGTVTLNADGSFVVNPAAGFTGGSVSFQYRVLDSGNPAPGLNSAYTTVNVAVSGPVVWFADDSAAAGGDGTLAKPFQTLAAANTAANNAAHEIFLFDGSYTGGITLTNGVKLFGQGVSGASFDAVLGISPPTGSTARPIINGTDPVITTTAASTNGVNLAVGASNTIKGLTIGNTTGSKIASGASFGTLTVADTTLNGTGQALNLTSGTLAATFDAVSSSSATTGLSLTTVGGSLTMNGGALATLSGDDVFVSGGNASITYAGTITNTAGHSINIASHTGGTIAFSGAISDTGTGISLTNNGGATINFTGGLNLSTGVNTAFSATGGGTVNATQNNTGIVNTIITTTGTALNVVSTTIGGSGLTFRSISANGGANGIVLDTTGAAGGLTVTGAAGSVTRDSSGGTIQSIAGADGATTGHGIYLNSTSNVSLNHMNIHNVQGDGIHGNSVAGFTLTYTSMTTNGTTTAQLGNFHGEGDVQFVNLTGSAQVDHNDFQLAFYNTFGVFNVSAVTLDRIVMGNNTFGANDTTGGNAGVVFQPQGGTMNITFGSSPATANTITGAGSNTFIVDMHGTAHVDLIMKNNAISNNHTNIVTGGGGVSLQSGGAGDAVTFTFNVDSNTFSGSHGAGFFIGTGQVTNGNTFTGTFNNNTIGVQAVANSGSTTGNDLFIDNEGGSTSINVTNNRLYQYNPNGTGALQLQVANDNGHEAHATFVVTGNTISNPGTTINVYNGIQLNAGTTAGDTAKTNLTLFGNTVVGSGNTTTGSADIRLRQRFSATIGLFGNGSNYGGTPNDTTAIANFAVAQNGGTGSVVSSAPGGFFGTARFLLAAPGGVAAAKPTPATTLKLADLNAIKDAAIQRWQQAGISAKQLAALKAVSFDIADLPGQTLGLSSGTNKITIDSNAAGYGWYVDTTPMDDKEFSKKQSATRFSTTPIAAPAGRMDLLTAVMHEMGHILGLDHSGSREDLMYESLVTGERRLPGRIPALR